jgi:hypothetical protein
MDIPIVPQLAPEIRVLPMDELLVYEGEGGEEHPIEADPDGQIDVCAIEEGDNVEVHENDNSMDGPTASKQTRSNSGAAVKMEGEQIDTSTNENQPRSERYRILRRTGNENLASRVRRETTALPPVKNDDDLMLECKLKTN